MTTNRAELMKLRDWVIGYLPTPVNRPTVDLIICAFAEWDALAAAMPESECTCPKHGSWIAAADVQRMARELDVAMNGEEGAAQQPSLCDVVRPAIKMIKSLRAAMPESGEAARRVGCEGEDGLIRVHAEVETCELCASPPAKPAEPINWGAFLFLMADEDWMRLFADTPELKTRLAAIVDKPAAADTLCARLQMKCSEWGAYWRAPDAHGVILTTEQALELLQDALGVEVEIPKLEDLERANKQLGDHGAEMHAELSKLRAAFVSKGVQENAR